jgi:hypothetical protein
VKLHRRHPDEKELPREKNNSLGAGRAAFSDLPSRTAQFIVLTCTP